MIRAPIAIEWTRGAFCVFCAGIALHATGCNRSQPTASPPPTTPPQAAAPAVPVVSPAPTNTAAMILPPERTPAELFQAGLKLSEGKGVTKDPTEAVRLFKLAAERGHVDAQAYLAGAYRTGVGVEKNPAEAMHWFRAAAEQGDARSQGVLASIYGTGEGVPKDLPEAVKWYRLAAEQGLVRAQANLGAMLYLGQGVAKDPVEAYKWLHLAALKNDPDALKNRALVAKVLSVEQMAAGRKRAAEFVPTKTQ